MSFHPNLEWLRTQLILELSNNMVEYKVTYCGANDLYKYDIMTYVPKNTKKVISKGPQK